VQKKKLLGSTLALGMLFPAQSFAADSLVKGLKFGGQIDIQATDAKNVSDFSTHGANPGTPAAGNSGNDRISDVQTRILLHADWDVLDDVHAKVTLRKNDRTWGTGAGTLQGTPTAAAPNAGNSQTIGAPGGNNILGTIAVDQAYVKIDKLGGAVDLTAGRQFYGTSGDMVIYFGPSDKAEYGLPSTSIDAARLDWAGSWGGLTAMGGRVIGQPIATLGGATGGVNSIDVFGLNAAIKGTDMVSGAAYVYNRHGNSTGLPALNGTAANPQTQFAAAGDSLWIVGAKAKAQAGMAWVAGEVAKNFGTNRFTNGAAGAAGTAASRAYTGWAAKADIGAKLDTPIGGVAPWGHLGYGTGDSNSQSGSNHGFAAIAGDYRPGGIYGRFSGNGLFSNGVANLGNGVAAANPAATLTGNPYAGNGTLTNRVIWGVGVKTTPSMMNKLTAGVSYWDYRTQTQGLPVTATVPTQLSGNKHIGSEFDVDLAWQHSENVAIGVGFGDFQPGGMIRALNQANGLGSNPALMGYADLRVKF